MAEAEGTQGAVLRSGGLCGVPPIQGMILARPLILGTFPAWSLRSLQPQLGSSLLVLGSLPVGLHGTLTHKLEGSRAGAHRPLWGRGAGQPPGEGQGGQQAERCGAQPAFPSDRRCQSGARHGEQV